jgi:hypothetical protein
MILTAFELLLIIQPKILGDSVWIMDQALRAGAHRPPGVLSMRKRSWYIWCCGITSQKGLGLVVCSNQRKIEISTTEKMTNVISLCKCVANVPRRGVTVGMYTFCSYDGVERFEGFRSKEDGRPESLNMFSKVYKNVEFGLVEPTRSPACST